MSKTFPDFSFERAAHDRGARFVVGMDEVGRGPWAGPVTACAVMLTAPPPDGLNDSKQMSGKRRIAMEPLLHDCCAVGYGEATVAEIDRLNIRQATHLAMRRAIVALPFAPDHLLIDGIDCPDWVKSLPNCSWQTIKGGDGRSLSIAAASVLAKTRRDQGMVSLAQQFPGYGWETNAGYGTATHRQGLENHGVTQHHRRSFAPIRKMLCQ
ncbi:ribonuclease HII [Jannaschia sp. 2305UL9-9]|uniref:ribonuclease HII n=1 Tax=Jannaschia sp. 2305UL9-9 TaxID=3121638 RepID=UPI0035295206